MSNRIFFPFLISLLCAVNLTQAQSDTVYNQIDSRGLKQGYWKKYYPNGKLMYKGFFRDNKPVGEMRRYYESGALKVVMLFTGTEDFSRSTLYYETGELAAKGNYIGTAKDSTWEYFSFYDHSIKAREDYTLGKKNGLSFHYFPDGTASEKMEWNDNMKHGIWEQYHPNKKIKIKGVYKEDKLNGPFYVFDAEGILSVQGAFLNNLRHGKWVFYKEDGAVDIELVYNQGKPDKEDAMTEKQKEVFRMIDENIGKYDEPNETDFLR